MSLILDEQIKLRDRGANLETFHEAGGACTEDVEERIAALEKVFEDRKKE